MESNQRVRKFDARCHCSGNFVADDNPCGSRKPFVEDLGDYSDISVRVGGDDQRRIDVGHPELGEGSIERWEQKCCEVVEERSSKSVEDAQDSCVDVVVR